MTNLAGKVALITGSARGIGRAIAERLGSLEPASSSTIPRIAGAQARPLQRSSASPGQRLPSRRMSRTWPKSRACSRPASRGFGHIDIVVANAGVELIDRPLLEVTEATSTPLLHQYEGPVLHAPERGEARDRQRPDHPHWVEQHGLPPAGILYGGSKTTPPFVVEVLAEEIGARGITVNSILPTAIEGAGVFTDQVAPEFREFIKRFRPMQRMGTVEDVADAAEYLASALSGFVHLLVSGGAPA